MPRQIAAIVTLAVVVAAPPALPADAPYFATIEQVARWLEATAIRTKGV